MTYKIVCTNPVTKQFTEPVTGIATRTEANQLRESMQLDEKLSDTTKRTGVCLVLTVEVDR